NHDGATGDCYFLAAMGAIANKSPADLQNMFIDNGDGTFTVRFFNGPTAEYVTVNQNLPVQSDGTAQYDNFARLGSNRLWVALAEKAYAQLNEEGWIGQDGTNSYAGLEGGRADLAMAQISGRSPGVISTAQNHSDSTRDNLITKFNSGQAITLSTYD